jgi:hypothetical protein
MTLGTMVWRTRTAQSVASHVAQAGQVARHNRLEARFCEGELNAPGRGDDVPRLLSRSGAARMGRVRRRRRYPVDGWAFSATIT